MDEVLKGWKPPLFFLGVFFKSSLLLIDCKDEETAAALDDQWNTIIGTVNPFSFMLSTNVTNNKHH